MKKKQPFKKIVIPKCPWHQSPELGYLQWHRDAEKRQEKGEQQKECPVCGYWFWPEHFGVDPITKLKAPSK